MARLNDPFLERVETLSHRIVDVAEAVAENGRSPRVVDQMIGAGSSIGANVWEASEALSSKGFCKGLGIGLKELREARYWLRFVVRRGWIKAARVSSVQQEADEMQRILGSMVARTRKRTK
jgi:four helix bundle protein